jgi:hypothetical protein
MGRSGGHQRGLSMAAYGEILMATVINVREQRLVTADAAAGSDAVAHDERT